MQTGSWNLSVPARNLPYGQGGRRIMDGSFDPSTGRIRKGGGLPRALLRWSGIALTASSWLSAGLFGAYILSLIHI